MRVLISWSEKQSKAVAEALKEWLDYFFEKDPETWMSEHDIAAGERWGNQLNKVLAKSSFGILCLTRENINAPWILFEAGSLAKTLEFSRVVPYCLELSPTEIGFPLQQFQGVQANKAGTFKLVQSINEVRHKRISTEHLKHAFETWWPQLGEKLNKIHVVQRMEVVDVSTLADSLGIVLREKQKQPGFSRSAVRILAADASELLFTHIEEVILADWLKAISFEFCIVDPDFAAIAEINPDFGKYAKKSLNRIAELAMDPRLAKKKVSILPARTYKHHPNTWGVLVDDSDLFIGFHNWVAQDRLEGTEHGVIYLRSGDPLWDRFFSLFTTWFDHSEIKQKAMK